MNFTLVFGQLFSQDAPPAAESSRPVLDLPIIIPLNESSEEARFAQKWQKLSEQKFDWNYQAIPLNEVMADITRKLDVLVQLSERDLRETGIDPKTPVVFHAQNITVRSALRLILNELGLTYLTRYGKVIITIPDCSQSPEKLPKKIYYVGDLFQLHHDEWEGCPDNLLNMLHLESPSPFSPEIQNSENRGRFVPIAGDSSRNSTFLLRGTPDFHERAEKILRALCRLKREFDAQPAKVTSPRIDITETNAAYEILDKVTSFRFDGSYRELAVALQEKTGIHFHVGAHDLKEVGLNADNKISDEFRDVSLRVGLQSILHPQGLGFCVSDESILITNREVSTKTNRLIHRIYPVYDLIPHESQSCKENLLQLCEAVEEIGSDFDWSSCGGPFQVTPSVPPALLVSADAQTHVLVEELLSSLRKVGLGHAKWFPPKSNDRYIRRIYTLKQTLPPKVMENPFDPEAIRPIVREYTTEETQALVEFLKRNVATPSWDDAQTVCDSWRNRLYVRQNPEVIEEIEKILEKMNLWSD